MAEPENLVLAQLKALRSDVESYRAEAVAHMEHVKRALEIMGRVNPRLDAIDARLGRIEGDLVQLENQNISRHGETMNLARELGATSSRHSDLLTAIHDLLSNPENPDAPMAKFLESLVDVRSHWDEQFREKYSENKEKGRAP